MIKKIFLALPVILFAGCVKLVPPVTAAGASEQIRAGKADCIVIKHGKISASEKGRGLSPLLNIYLTAPEALKEAVVVDKVIGRAAAFVIIAGKSRQAHGELISEDAIELLKKHDIAVSGTKIVPRILNRRMDGLCPLEQSVAGINDPEEAVAALQKRIAEMSGKK